MTTRLSINLNDETAATLRKASAVEGRTVTEVVRRAVGVYEHCMEAARDGSTVKIVDANGNAKVVTFL